MRPFKRILFMVVLVLAFLEVHPSFAAIVTVDTLTDENDGSCSDGDCSLRDAIQVATSGDTIKFSVTGTITLIFGELIIDKNLAISGPGGGSLIISANNLSRVFYVNAGVTAAITDVVIADGNAGSDEGGGIDNYGTLIVNNSTLSNNSAAGLNGGGINNQGTLTASNSTFSDNMAKWGGGIKNEGGTATVINCTFSGNWASIRGGGIDSGASSILYVANSTFSNNGASFAGGIGNPSSTTTVRNVIIANSTGSNCSSAFATGGNNLSTDNTCSPGFTQVTAVQLALAPLADNGGPTETMALQFGSVAINAANPAYCPATDQRGFNRPDVCDIGAYEFGAGYELSISKTGQGTGSVTSTPAGINCDAATSSCDPFFFSFNTHVSLFADPSGGSIFLGWSGDADCNDGTVTISTDVACTAKFDQCGPRPAQTGSGTPYGSIALAYAGAETIDTIKVIASNQQEGPLDLSGKSVVMVGGYDCSFDNIVSYTVVTGSITISTGDVTFENIVIL